MTCEIARAGLELYYAHRPRQPIVAIIYTHSHVDHFGGIKGIVSAEDVSAGRIPVIAPDGFMEAVGGENVLAGLPMARRAQYQFGILLPTGERQQVDADIGKGFARGTVSLIAPTDLIKAPIETRSSMGSSLSFTWRPKPKRRRRCISICRHSASSTWLRTRPTTCTTSSHCAVRWRATRASGRIIWLNPSSCSRTNQTY